MNSSRGLLIRGDKFRNVAIVAHVDHGKTTLVDALLSSTDARTALNDRVMDSNDLERERGITILSKVTSMPHGEKTINLVDTPGHSDFSGEVERVLSMVDGICLVVCATEGPMPQTKYVLSKALALGLLPVVVINKVDRPTARVAEVENEVFDLFCSLDANDDQLEYKTIYTSGKDGWSSLALPSEGELESFKGDMTPLLDTIVGTIPSPRIDKTTSDLRMLVSIMESDPSIHLGKLLLTGRILSGSLKTGDTVHVMNPDGKTVDDAATVVKLMKRVGTARYEIDGSTAGDLVTIAGILDGRVGDTICAQSAASHGPLKAPKLDPATISMFFAVNDSPLAGNKESSGGSKLTQQMLMERLHSEALTNVAIQIEKETRNIDGRESFEVHGRGEMQLGILIESMRREGFELSVSPPKALFIEDDEGKKLEPVEEISIDVPEEIAGKVMELVIGRKGDLTDASLNEEGSRRKMSFHIPSRGMVGLRAEITRMCRGDCIVNSVFFEYQPHKGRIGDSRKGVILSSAAGIATSYALDSAEARGELFIGPNTDVYQGMIIGENSRSEDIEVNITKTKKLTNIRAAGKDDTVRLTPPRVLTLEDAIGYINSDEIIEVTPHAIRLRKSVLGSVRKARKN
ncbi:Tyrosine phosphorylated protein A [Hondaea fermentalgiana]|uniref:Tyrosine phosphorylated protein A n=1 Tax=Hondaea fermentalgiana TaxID=2315210 RepID=A0A2R5GAE0_9STRA|nr:Tyrosine phosphorylated protein A [Hondaea fermentalgiana]|eukprot:GBG27996.1 Tyrosine phosphorylated protein A [Hondaea fermentalgiana]